MSESKKLVSVLIVKDEITKSIHINASLISLIKPIIAFICALIPALIATIIFLIQTQNPVIEDHSQENLELKKQLAELKDAKSKEIEKKLAVLKNVEDSITQLEDYLQERGVKIEPIFADSANNLPNDAAGGPINDAAGGPINDTASGPINDTASDSTNDAVGGSIDNVARDLVDGEETVFLNESTQEEITSLFEAIRMVPIGYPYRGKISSYFGDRSNPFTGRGAEKHGGIDFRGKIGDTIKATADGVIIHAGSGGGYGNLVKIKHQYGYSTYYAHLSSVSVKAGQKIKAGDVIGSLGSTGRSTGPHLHYEVRKNEQRLDPVEFLSLK